MPQSLSHNSVTEHYYELAKAYFHTLHFFKICYNFVPPFYTSVGLDSSIGIAIGYGWTVRESNPGAAETFSTRPDHPGAHLASCTMDTGSFSGVMRLGRGADHPPLLAPRSRECRAGPLPPTLWAFQSVTGYLYLYHLYLSITNLLSYRHHVIVVRMSH
jgi:hypothetical protein